MRAVENVDERERLSPGKELHCATVLGANNTTLIPDRWRWPLCFASWVRTAERKNRIDGHGDRYAFAAVVVILYSYARL